MEWPFPPLMGMFSVTWVSTVYLGARKQFLNFAEACSAPSTTSPVTSSSHFCGREMACGRRCCEAGWCKVLKDTEDDCLGDGLLSRVGVACTGHIYLYLFKEIRVYLSPRVSF